MKRWREFLPLYFLLAAVAGLHLLHHDPNYQLSDAAFYIERAQDIYLAYRNQGFLEGLQFQYFERHWKPVLGQHLFLPFLAAAGGDTRAAFPPYALVMALFLAGGVYFALSGWIRDRMTVALASLLFLLAPWVLSDQFEFGSEASWLAFSAWFFGFYIRGYWGWAAAMLVLSVCSRPVEAVLCLWIPFAFVLLGNKWKRPLMESAVVLAVTFYPYAVLKREYSAVMWFLFAGLAIAYLVAKFVFVQDRREKIWSSMLAAVFLFFLPSLFNMVDWSWRSAVGPLVDRVNYPGQEQKSFFVLAFVSAGIFLNAPLAAALVFPRKTAGFWKIRKPQLFVLGWAALFLAVLVFFASGSREIRMYHLSWMALAFISAASYSAALENRTWTARLLLAVLVGLQAYGALPPYYLKERSQFSVWPGWWPVSQLTGDPGHFKDLNLDSRFLEFYDYLQTLPIPDDAFILFIQRDTSPMAHFTMNPWRYSIRARENGKHWYTAPYFRRTDGKLDRQGLFEKAISDGEVFVVGPPLTAPEEFNKTPKDVEEMLLSAALFECFPDCERFGFEALGQYAFPETRDNPAQKYLVFKKVQPSQSN